MSLAHDEDWKAVREFLTMAGWKRQGTSDGTYFELNGLKWYPFNYHPAKRMMNYRVYARYMRQVVPSPLDITGG